MILNEYITGLKLVFHMSMKFHFKLQYKRHIDFSISNAKRKALSIKVE